MDQSSSSHIPNSANHNVFENDPDGPNRYNRQNSSPHRQSPPNNPQNGLNPEIAGQPNHLFRPPTHIHPGDIDDQAFFNKIRGSLMIVAILAAGSTYQAGLNPPGSVWQDSNGHKAGTPILHDTFFSRYQTFFYCNAISFLSSLVIIVFLMNKEFYCDKRNIKVLEITMVLDLFSFMAAYAVGSCRRVTSSIYVFLIMGAVFLYVISLARHYSVLHDFANQISCSCMRPKTSSTVMEVRADENV